MPPPPRPDRRPEPEPRPRPYESPEPARPRPLAVPPEEPFLHHARRVRFASLYGSGVRAIDLLRARIVEVRLTLALARAAGTWRYRARLVRWLRADVGFFEAAPLRSLVDHRLRAVYFDFDQYIDRSGPFDRDPALLDEARHIRDYSSRGNAPAGDAAM